MSWPTTLGFLDAQRFGERMNADGSGLHVQAVLGNRRIADAGQVGRDHGEFLGEQRNDRPPHARCLRVAVQQDHRRAVTRRQVMQLYASDFGGTRADRVLRLARVPFPADATNDSSAIDAATKRKSIAFS